MVWATGAVSYLTDFSTELVYPLLPAFYRASLGLSPLGQGIVEGFAEAVVSLARLGSGLWSDRTGHRRRWMLAGYGLSAAAKPLLGLAASGPAALLLRAADRLGKGIRGAPRDALLSISLAPAELGRAFGVQRALDHAGALSGALVASGLLLAGLVTVRELFLWTLVPGALALLTIALFVREAPPPPGAPAATPAQPLAEGASSNFFPIIHAWTEQPAALRRYLGVLGLFALGNSTDALLLLRAREQMAAGGVASPDALLPLLWAWLHLVKSSSTGWGGRLGDRFGRARALAAGWLVYAVVYTGFAFGTGAAAPWVLFGIYGLYYGLAEGSERALVAELAPDARRRGLAYGLYSGVVGLAALPASLLCGGLWLLWGPAPAFAAGAALALAAAALLHLPAQARLRGGR